MKKTSSAAAAVVVRICLGVIGTAAACFVSACLMERGVITQESEKIIGYISEILGILLCMLPEAGKKRKPERLDLLTLVGYLSVCAILHLALGGAWNGTGICVIVGIGIALYLVKMLLRGRGGRARKTRAF